MPRFTRHRLIAGALLLLLLLLLAASVAANILLYRQASRPLFADGDRPLIERTVAMFAAAGSMSAADIRAQSFPIVLHLGDRTCVELRYHAVNYGDSALISDRESRGSPEKPLACRWRE